MANRRMLDKKISISEQVSNLPLEAQIIFTWSIPHADDLGLLPISHKTLKAMIVPMLNISQETFDFQINKIIENQLFDIFEQNDERFYRLVKFKDHQTLKKDRKPITYLNNIISWEQVENLGFHLETIGNPREDKRREDKIREEKSKDTYGEFKNVFLKKEEFEKLIITYGEKNTNVLIEELSAYMESKKKYYASHYATLLNWGRRKIQDYKQKSQGKKRTIGII